MPFIQISMYIRSIYTRICLFAVLSRIPTLISWWWWNMRLFSWTCIILHSFYLSICMHTYIHTYIRDVCTISGVKSQAPLFFTCYVLLQIFFIASDWLTACLLCTFTCMCMLLWWWYDIPTYSCSYAYERWWKQLADAWTHGIWNLLWLYHFWLTWTAGEIGHATDSCVPTPAIFRALGAAGMSYWLPLGWQLTAKLSNFDGQE